MKIVVVIGAVIIGLVGIFLLVSEPSEISGNTDVLSEVSLSTFESDVASGIPLVDVRTPEEFEVSHIESAFNLPLDDIKSGETPNATKDEKIYLYCRSGNRSAEAKQILERVGYTNIVDLGGMNEVVALGGKQVN